MEQFNKYNLSIIYAIKSKFINKFYLGSTALSLQTRFCLHRKAYNRFIEGKHSQFSSAFKVMCFPDCYIECIHIFNCNTKSELLEKEREYYDMYQLTLVNQNKPMSTPNEKKIQMKMHNDKRKHQTTFCHICNISIGTRYYNIHLNNRKHRKNVLDKVIQDIFLEELTSDDNVEPIEDMSTGSSD